MARSDPSLGLRFIGRHNAPVCIANQVHERIRRLAVFINVYPARRVRFQVGPR